MHKTKLDDAKIAIAHTVFNMIWKLAELLRNEFKKYTPVSEIVPERGLWLKIQGLYYRAEYPLPVFFIFSNKVKIGVELSGVYAIMLIDRNSMNEEFIRKMISLDLNFVAYGAENFVEDLFNSNTDVNQIIKILNECEELMIQIEIKRDLNDWRGLVRDVLEFLRLAQEYDVKLYPIIFPEVLQQ